MNSVLFLSAIISLLEISKAHYPAWHDSYWHSKGYWPWEVKTERQYWGNTAWSAPLHQPVQHAAFIQPPPPVLQPVHTVIPLSPQPEPLYVAWAYECSPDREAYDIRSGQCLTLGHQGPPCGENTVFVRTGQNAFFGECKCTRPASTCGRPLSHWPDHERCYELYTQGPCEADEWLVPVRSVTSRCDKNPCGAPNATANNGDGSTGQNPMFNFAGDDGKCYTTETQAFCGEGQVARFIDGNGGPACYGQEENNCFGLVINKPALVLMNPPVSRSAISVQDSREQSSGNVSSSESGSAESTMTTSVPPSV